jgi:hypothetical protein
MAEILLIREDAERKYQEEQRRLDKEAEVKYLKRIENTIEFCETTLNDSFEEQAKNRHNTFHYDINCVIKKDRLGNKQIIPLVKNGEYANGEVSRCPSSTIKYDYNTLINYLAQFCYQVEFAESSYKRYGSGSHNSTMVTIKFAD